MSDAPEKIARRCTFHKEALGRYHTQTEMHSCSFEFQIPKSIDCRPFVNRWTMLSRFSRCRKEPLRLPIQYCAKKKIVPRCHDIANFLSLRFFSLLFPPSPSAPSSPHHYEAWESLFSVFSRKILLSRPGATRASLGILVGNFSPRNSAPLASSKVILRQKIFVPRERSLSRIGRLGYAVASVSLRRLDPSCLARLSLCVLVRA